GGLGVAAQRLDHAPRLRLVALGSAELEDDVDVPADRRRAAAGLANLAATLALVAAHDHGHARVGRVLEGCHHPAALPGIVLLADRGELAERVHHEQPVAVAAGILSHELHQL